MNMHYCRKFFKDFFFLDNSRKNSYLENPTFINHPLRNITVSQDAQPVCLPVVLQSVWGSPSVPFGPCGNISKQYLVPGNKPSMTILLWLVVFSSGGFPPPSCVMSILKKSE